MLRTFAQTVATSYAAVSHVEVAYALLVAAQVSRGGLKPAAIGQAASLRRYGALLECLIVEYERSWNVHAVGAGHTGSALHAIYGPAWQTGDDSITVRPLPRRAGRCHRRLLRVVSRKAPTGAERRVSARDSRSGRHCFKPLSPCQPHQVYFTSTLRVVSLPALQIM